MISGQEVHVTYDLPEIGREDAPVSGGVLGFQRADAGAFQCTRPFTLRTPEGREVEGAVVRVYGRSAAVIIAP
jgi:hypothetical protein